MGMLDRERAWQFNIHLDGEVRGHVVKCGQRWHLRRADLEVIPGYDGIDVTAGLDQSQAIAVMLRGTVSAKPLTSVALAFGGDALAAFLIGRFTR